MLPTVYDFPCFSTYVSAYLKERKTAEEGFSMRGLSRRMGLTSPSTLAMIASGQRLPSQKLLHKFAEAARLSKRELEYAETLLHWQKAANTREKALYAERLRQMRPGAETVVIGYDQFEFIAKWYHVAILEMTNLKDFDSDPARISARLGGLVTAEQAAEACERLVRLGLLAQDDRGVLRKTSGSFRSPSGIPNAAARMFHHEMMDLAGRALETQPVSERYFTSQTMTIRRERYDEAKKLFQDFFEKMRSLIPVDGDAALGDETYHLSLQFFRLTHAEGDLAPPAGATH